MKKVEGAIFHLVDRSLGQPVWLAIGIGYSCFSLAAIILVHNLTELSPLKPAQIAIDGLMVIAAIGLALIFKRKLTD